MGVVYINPLHYLCIIMGKKPVNLRTSVEKYTKEHQRYIAYLEQRKTIDVGQLQHFIFKLIDKLKHENHNTKLELRDKQYHGKKAALWWMFNMCRMLKQDIDFDSNDFFEKVKEYEKVKEDFVEPTETTTFVPSN